MLSLGFHAFVGSREKSFDCLGKDVGQMQGFCDGHLQPSQEGLCQFVLQPLVVREGPLVRSNGDEQTWPPDLALEVDQGRVIGTPEFWRVWLC